MDIHEVYREMAKNCGIEVGDTVRILRKANNLEMGWDQMWLYPMDRYVGEIDVVTDVTDAGSFQLENGYWFPFFVLEKIKSARKEKKMQTGDLVKVYDGSWSMYWNGEELSSISGNILKTMRFKVISTKCEYLPSSGFPPHQNDTILQNVDYPQEILFTHHSFVAVAIKHKVVLEDGNEVFVGSELYEMLKQRIQ